MYECQSPIHCLSGYKIEALNQKVYTFEGFCYYLYHHFEALMEPVKTKDFLPWVVKILGMVEIGKQLEEKLFLKEKISEQMIEILNFCVYVETLDLADFKQKVEAYEQRPTDQQYKQKGDRCIQEGNYKEGLSWYKKAQKINYSWQVANNMATVYGYWGNTKKALHLLEQAILQEDQPTLSLNKLSLLMSQNLFEEMLAYLKEIQVSDKLWYYYGRAYQGLGKKEEAITAYLRGYEETSWEMNIEQLVNLEIQLGHIEQARWYMTQFDLTLQVEKYLQAKTAESQKDDYAYRGYMEEAIQASGNEKRYLLELSKHYLKDHQVIKALEYMKMLKKEDQLLEEVRYHQACIAREAGNQTVYNTYIETVIKQWKQEIRDEAMG